MKKTFEDQSFIEIKKEGGTILVVLGASKKNNISISCVELSIEEFKEMIKDVIQSDSL